MKSFFFMLGALSLALVTTMTAACGSDGASTSSGGSAIDAASGADAGPASCAPSPAPPEVRNVSCAVTLETLALQQPNDKHLPENTAIEYCSNPPTSGPHYPVWTTFAEFTQPVDWPYLVHSEEHGAVLLLYKCDPACPEIIEQLRQVKERAPADCGGAKRIIIAPAPTLTTRVAAAAWGKTLSADCVDGPTMDEFVAANIGKGPENICAPGRPFQ